MHILGSYFLLMWGVGVVRIIFNLVRDKFWAPSHSIRCTSLVPVSGIYLVTDAKTHTWKNYWLTNLNSIRIHIRPKIPVIWHVFIPVGIKGAQSMKCTLWIETLEFWRSKVLNSRFALHGLAPPKFTFCALFLSLSLALCAFFRPLLTPVSTAPFFAGLSVRLHFTVYAPSNFVPVLESSFSRRAMLNLIG